MRLHHVISLLCAVLALGAGCTCGKPPTPSGSGDAGSATPNHPPLTLAPLPEAPKIQVAPEAVPGANGELAVVNARPTGDFEGALHPTITFSKPIVALGSVDDEQKLAAPATIEPHLDGTWRWLGSASVEFEPKGQVPYATDFKITVAAGITALDGTTLKEPYSYTFNTPRPDVQDVTPFAHDPWLTPDQTFTITFNQPVKDLLAHLQVMANNQPVKMEITKTVDIAAERRAEDQGRRYAREPLDEESFRNRQTRYELKPSQPMAKGASVDFTIDTSLAGTDGPLTLPKTYNMAYRTYGPMKFIAATACHGTQGCSYGPLVLTATNQADLESLRAHFSVLPKVDIDWEHAESEFSRWEKDTQFVTLPGNWKPGQTYEIAITAGALDAYKQPAPGFRARVRMNDVEPSLSVGAEQALLEAKGDGALPLYSVNLKQADARVWALGAPLAAKILAQSGSLYNFDAVAAKSFGPDLEVAHHVDEKLDLAHTKNQALWTPLKIREWLGADQSNLFLVRVDSDDLLPQRHRPQYVLGQITDLAVHAKLGAAQSLVWVTSLASGKPVSGAAVNVLDRDGKNVWSGQSDADGLCDMPGLEQLMPHGKARHFYDEAPFAVVTAQKDGDLGLTASGWEGSANPYAFGVTPAWETSTPVTLAQAFTDRGIYRPGDAVELKGFFRDRVPGAIKNVGVNLPVHIVITNPKGQKLSEQDVKTTAFGGFSGHAELGKDAPLGTYEIVATSARPGAPLSVTTNFRVEEYRAPQFQVDVSTPKPEVIAGDPLTATVLSRYLFGGAMAGAHVRWTAVRATTDFEPPNNPGFVFGPHAWWWNDDQPQPSSDVAGGGEADSDAQGNVVIDLGKAEAPGNKTYQYTVEAETTDVNRQRLANRTTITVHPAAVYPGLSSGEGFGEVNKPTKVEVVAVDPTGARTPSQKVSVQVKRREWKSIKKKGVGGEWFTEAEPVETDVTKCDVTTQTTPVDCTFTPAQPGLYLLIATATDSAGRSATTRSSLYAIGSGWVSWQRGDTDRIDLVADKAKYDVGDVAHVLVKSPYPEADAVLTTEREGVLTRKHVHLTGAATALDVPIDEKMVPNVFVGLVLVRGRVPTADGVETGSDPGRPASRFGYIELPVEKKTKRLAVVITPDKAEAKPRDTIDVSVKVSDFQGKPVHGEVALYAVDEGVLRLTNYQAPDPVEALHQPRGLSVRIAEPLIHLVEKQLYGEKGETQGGGGGDDATGSGFRSQFKTTVLFAPALETDANGVAHTSFTLPDNLTTYRLMAVAIDDGDRGGFGNSKVVVSKKLMALPALPRLARAGDEFEAGVVVHAHGSDVAEATVTAQAEGVTLEEPTTRTVALGDGKGHEVRFKFKAEKPGTATLRFKVSGGGDSDGVEQKIPIQLPTELEAVATYGDTKDQRVEGLVPPGGVRPDVGGLDVTLSSTILGGFNEGMRQLVEYPYGCVEQMSSRLIPFVALREIYGKFGGTWPVTEADRKKQMDREKWFALWLGDDSLEMFGLSDPDEVVKLTLGKIGRMQNHDGGFRYWEGEGCSSDYASSYAVLALARAKDVGYPVDASSIAAGQKFLQRVARGEPNRCYPFPAPPDPSERAFALYTLARTGNPQPSSYADLYANRKDMPLFAQAMLADAMFIGKGDRTQAKQLLSELMNRAQETPREVHFEEINARSYAAMWSSDTRTTAIILGTLTDISPDHPYVAKIGNYLTKIRQGAGQFRNTQEAAFSLMSLAEVVRTKEKDVPDFTAHVKLGAKELLTASFQGRSTTVQTQKVPITALGSAEAKQTFTFSKDGPGVLYYGALLRYAPAQMPLTPMDRGIVVQRWYEPYAGGGQSKSFFAGDLVRVRVRVATPQERNYVAIDVPLPAGLEIVDTSLASTAKLPDDSKDEGRQTGYHYDSDEDQDSDNPEVDDTSPARLWEGQFWSPFNFTEKHDDRLTLFADHLPPGVHVSSFVARATTPGTFLDKPAHAEEMYTPEVFGRSEGGTFQVIDASTVAQK